MSAAKCGRSFFGGRRWDGSGFHAPVEFLADGMEAPNMQREVLYHFAIQ